MITTSWVNLKVARCLAQTSVRNRIFRALSVRIGAFLREFHTTRLTCSLKACGHGVSFQWPVFFAQPEKIEIGDSVSIAAYVHIWGAGGVVIGSRTMIGAGTAVSSVTHDYTQPEMYRTVVTAPIRIGEDVWIGTHSIILPGVTVGNGAVVGAGSLLRKDVPAMGVVAGIPARLLKMRQLADPPHAA